MATLLEWQGGHTALLHSDSERVLFRALSLRHSNSQSARKRTGVSSEGALSGRSRPLSLCPHHSGGEWKRSESRLERPEGPPDPVRKCGAPDGREWVGALN